MNRLLNLNYKLLNLTIFSNILKDPLMASLLGVFAYSEKSLSESLVYYSKFLKILYESEFEGDFSKYLQNLIVYDENKISRSIYSSPCIERAFNTELGIINELLSITCEDIKAVLKENFKGSDEIVNLAGNFISSEISIDGSALVDFWRKNSYGIFAKYSAFRFDKDLKLKPVTSIDNISLNDLKDYQTQKKKLIENTLSFINGTGANNILLYGDRGCGKSSSVKAVFNEYKNQGLKIVQILKADLMYLDKLMSELEKIALKFIVFIDDLSFSQEDENLSALKSVLEGAISKQPDNIIIYATTNRRHIIKETFSSREGNEVHLADTIDENASLSDRFGMTLTFLAPNKDIFLNIALQIALDCGLEIDDEFYRQAERFALLKSSRSPRVAQQFVNFYKSQKAIV